MLKRFTKKYNGPTSHHIKRDNSPSCGVANVLDCDIEVCEFELQLHYYVYFRANTLAEGMNTPISQMD